MAKPEKPLASICAINASLSLVLLDADALDEWEPLSEDPADDDIGGHPQQVVELYEEDDFVSARLEVGQAKALVVTLEGMTGEAEVRRLADGTVALLEPPRAWWDDRDNYGKRKDDVAAMFTDVLSASPAAGTATVLGTVAVESGKLVAFDSNVDVTPAADVAADTEAGSVEPFGDDDGGVVIGLAPGTYAVTRRVVEPSWAEDQPLVVAYIQPA